MIGALVVMNYWFPDTFNSIFGDKISGENLSGQMRMEANEATRQLFQVFSLTNWLFGLGFGYTYNQVSDAVLANTGIIGFIIFCFVFLKPVWCLPRQGHLWGIQDLFNLTLSELFLLTTWMFLGLAYNKLDEYQKRRLEYWNEEGSYGLALRS